MDIGHYQPAWFFICALTLGFFPWIVFLPQALAASLPRGLKQRHAYQTALFLFLWAVLIFTFFSFSKSKLIPYILPIFPPLAILTARYLRFAIADKKWSKCENRLYSATPICSHYCLCFLLISAKHTHTESPPCSTLSQFCSNRSHRWHIRRLPHGLAPYRQSSHPNHSLLLFIFTHRTSKHSFH